MKAIKDCKWEIDITVLRYRTIPAGNNKVCWWVMKTFDYTGMCHNVDNVMKGIKNFKTKLGAINNFKRFAKLNGITNYEIKE